LERDPAGQSFARSRAELVAALARSMRDAGVAAMVYPTMPFNAFRLADGWPDVPTALGYGNWLGVPEVSVPAGLGADGLPALNLSVTGLPGEDAHVLSLAHAYERQSRRFVPPSQSRSAKKRNDADPASNATAPQRRLAGRPHHM